MSNTAAELHQPVSDLQLNQLRVEWVPRDSIHPNSYNPNVMSWHDRQLLKTSLLEDGWTQPIVTLPDRTIVDGEQRWTTSGIPTKSKEVGQIIAQMEQRAQTCQQCRVRHEHHLAVSPDHDFQGFPISQSILNRLKESARRLKQVEERGEQATIASITGGLVPITVVDFGDDAHKMISTIRHNRARGTHKIDSMSAITQDLVQLGLDFDDLERRLGMDDEEIKRFLNSAQGQMAQMEEELKSSDFSPAWQPTHVSELDPEAQVEFQRSQAASEAIKQHQQQLGERKQQIEWEKQARVQEIEAERGASLTQIEKQQIEKEIASHTPEPPKPKPPELKKVVFFVTPEELALIESVLGKDEMAKNLVDLCRERQPQPPAA